MIDYIKVRFDNKSKIDTWLQRNSKNVELKGKNVDYDTGAISTDVGKLHNLKITSTKNATYLEGSLHSYYSANNGYGAINHTDFHYWQLIEALDTLSKVLDYDLKETTITKLEAGFNLASNQNASDIIDKNILMYKNEAPLQQTRNTQKKLYKKFGNGAYVLKIYDKTKEANTRAKTNISTNSASQKVRENLLRIEIAYNSVEIKKRGIVSLDDLRNTKRLEMIFGDLTEKVGYLSIIDHLPSKGVGRECEASYYKYTNPVFWKNKVNKTYHKEKYKKLVENYELNNMKNYILDMLNTKYNELIIVDKLNNMLSE